MAWGWVYAKDSKKSHIKVLYVQLHKQSMTIKQCLYFPQKRAWHENCGKVTLWLIYGLWLPGPHRKRFVISGQRPTSIGLQASSYQSYSLGIGRIITQNISLVCTTAYLYAYCFLEMHFNVQHRDISDQLFFRKNNYNYYWEWWLLQQSPTYPSHYRPFGLYDPR